MANKDGIVTRTVENFVHLILWIVNIFAAQIVLVIIGILIGAADVKKSIIAYPGSAAVVLMTMAIALGATLSHWKIHHLKSYAAAEIVVGAVLGFNSAYRMPENNFRFTEILGIMSATYVVARGFNNLAAAEVSPEEDSVSAAGFKDSTGAA